MISPRALAASAVAGLATLAVGLAEAGPAVATVAAVACALAVALLVRPALARDAGAAQTGGEAIEAAADARLAGFRAALRLERVDLDGAVRNATIEEARRPTGRSARGGASPSRTTGVVIDELRSLAARVSGVSTQITEHAVALRDETRTVASSVGEARTSLTTGEAALAEAGAALGAVAAAVAGAAAGVGPAREAAEPAELDAALARLQAAHAALEARLDAP